MAPISEAGAHSRVKLLNTARISVVSKHASFLFLCSDLYFLIRHTYYILKVPKCVQYNRDEGGNR